jgi:peptidyl-prolyl cis-trans isomerase C
MNKRDEGWVVIILACLIFLWTTSFSCAAEKGIDEGKIAVVNGKIIPKSDFDREIIMETERISMQTGKTPSSDDLSSMKKNILESLINFELLYQESKKEGIQVDEKILTERYENFKKQASPEQFNEYLKQLKLSEAGIKDKFKTGLAVQQFVEKKFGQKALVSDQESKAFYDSNPGLFKIPEQVHASHILIKVAPKADAAQKTAARKKIEDIQKQLKNGDDFSELAKKVSDCPSSAKGGDLGYFRRGQMVKPFEDVAFSLKPGDVSGIVETDFGFHIIKVLDKKPETTLAYEQVKDRLAAKLKNDKIQKATDSYVDQLKKDAKIERYLKES